MRYLSVGALAVVIMTTPAFALDAGDTMQAWAGASQADKDALLRKLGPASGGSASSGSVRSCLDDTSKASGHSNLPIADVAKACSEQAARDNI